jgi:DNA-directed RNA polymerase specialized sigma24 family protein
MSDPKQHQELMGVLRTLLKVQALYAVRDLETKKEKVVFLNEGGLSHAEVGEVVGISADRVRKTVFAAKKKQPKED